jgi:hypothetical protein
MSTINGPLCQPTITCSSSPTYRCLHLSGPTGALGCCTVRCPNAYFAPPIVVCSKEMHLSLPSSGGPIGGPYIPLVQTLHPMPATPSAVQLLKGMIPTMRYAKSCPTSFFAPSSMLILPGFLFFMCLGLLASLLCLHQSSYKVLYEVLCHMLNADYSLWQNKRVSDSPRETSGAPDPMPNGSRAKERGRTAP